jgi:uncharacterized protein YbjT (DUF2867 family)
MVKLSGPDAAADSPLIFERRHGEIERHLAASGLPSVRLRPRTYMTNLLAYAGTVAETGMLFAPAGTAVISFVDPRDVGKAAAVCLTESIHDGQTYALTGPESISFERIAKELSVACGRTIANVNVDDGRPGRRWWRPDSRRPWPAPSSPSSPTGGPEAWPPRRQRARPDRPRASYDRGLRPRPRRNVRRRIVVPFPIDLG